MFKEPKDLAKETRKGQNIYFIFLNHYWKGNKKSKLQERINKRIEIRRSAKSFSCVRLFATPWAAAYQAPLSMGFSRQEYWSGLPFPTPDKKKYSCTNRDILKIE